MNKFIGLLLILVLAASCKNETESIVKITTEFGDIKIRLYDKTPKHRDNFLKLVDEKFYDGLLFHRVINHFMIQGGDPTSKNAGPDVMLGEGDVDYRIEAEFVPEYFHKKGVLAAAREGDDTNPERKSSGAQFYIVQGKVYSPEQLEATVKRINERQETEIINTEEVRRKSGKGQGRNVAAPSQKKAPRKPSAKKGPSAKKHDMREVDKMLLTQSLRKDLDLKD